MEKHGQPHDEVCAEATGTICVCACRGSRHGQAHRGGRPSVIKRMAEVTVTATTGGHGNRRDINKAGATLDTPRTASERRRDPVVVAEVDSPLGRELAKDGGTVVDKSADGDGPDVTATVGPTSTLPGNLESLSDDELLDAFTAATEQGREADTIRVWDEMGRREEAAAAAARAAEAQRVRIPEDLGGIAEAHLADLFAHVSQHGDEAAIQRIYAEMTRREDLAAAERARRAAPPAPDHMAAVAGDPYQMWENFKDPDRVYRTLGIPMGAQADPVLLDRAMRAERFALGLDADAPDHEVDAARRADSRSRDELGQWHWAWYRKLADADGIKPADDLVYGPGDSAVVLRRREDAAARAREAAAKVAADKARDEAIASGPESPARRPNPLVDWSFIGTMIDSYRTDKTGRDARERYFLAQTRTLGLADGADPDEIKKAAKVDPRSPGELAANYLAWYRLIGRHSDTGAPGTFQAGAEWAVGFDDHPDVKDPPRTLAPANVAKPWDVWQEIKTQAYADQAAGDPATFTRYRAAMARAYGMADDVSNNGISRGYTLDTRTKQQQAAAFIAEYRELGRAAGVDQGDRLRFGPPDRNTGRKSVSQWQELTPTQDAELERLLARGWDYLDAYAEVRGLDADALRREHAGQVAGRRAGETTERALRRQYDEWVHLRWREAEQATNGYLLNKAAAAAGITDPVVLFSGPSSTARAYASEELLRWWTNNPRMTFTQFKAQTAGGRKDKAAAKVTELAGNGRDFG